MHSVITIGEAKNKNKKSLSPKKMWPWGLSGVCERLQFQLLWGQQNKPDVMT